MKIYLDVDDVVIDSLSTIVMLLNKKFGTNVNPKDIHKWDYSDCFPNIKPQDVYEAFESCDFFNNVRLIDGAYKFITLHAKDITFTTIGTLKNLERKAEWLSSKGFNNCKFLGIPTNKTKGNYDMSDGILVDDNQKNLFISNAKRKILFNYRMDFTADWNNKWLNDCACDYIELRGLIYGY
jgi:5'(3')-deoxyribonucleotidase